MRRITVGSLALVVVVFHLCAFSASAQQSCPAPPIPAPAKDNIFTEEQENHLGDAVAEQISRSFRVIADDDVRAELQRIGEAMLKLLPPSNIRFQFFLVDLPATNAFAMPGGRIYVTRKMVAATRNEDELAGVVAHEIGHVVARDTAISISKMFRDVLRITEVGDRKDIYEKFHQFTENAMRRPEALSRAATKHSDQIDADQLGLFLMARAGYSPEKYVEFWDRFTETKGKKGNWFTDAFGSTRPESRRLREMSRTIGALPRECVAGRNTTGEEFHKWQSMVVAYTGLGHRESVPGLIMRKQLDPPLRGDVTHLRFSPDGAHILAQDDSGITILSREPFEPLFRIHAPEAFPAQFTPDSQEVIFHNAAMRVERWNVEEQQRTSVQEIALLKGCVQTHLSPDGKWLACYGVEWDLRLLDVEQGQSVYQKKEFYLPTFFEYIRWTLAFIIDDNFQPIHMGFSPDMRYFVAARHDTSLALEMDGFKTVSLRNPVKRLLSGGFVFLDSDRVMGVNAEKPEKSGIVSFTAGEMLDEIPLGSQALAVPGKGNYVLLRPIAKYPVGIMNLETKKIFMANKTPAIDIYDKLFVTERVTGELALHSGDAEGPIARTTLPRGNLGTIRAMALSNDMTWLAVSQRTRGAVWNLARGERVFHVRGFRGAYFDGDMLYADFPKFQGTERQIARLSLSQRTTLEGPTISDGETTQYGPYVIHLKPAKKDEDTDKNVTLEVHDARNMKVLWSRHFPKERPNIFVDPVDGTMVLRWSVQDSTARQEIKNDPDLKARWSSLKEKEGDYYLEVVTAQDGKRLGRLVLETGKGSFRIRNSVVKGDWLVMTDNQNRVLVHSLSSGEQKGRVFGANAAVSKATEMLCVENAQGQLSLYDLGSLEKRAEYVFTSPVSLVRFSGDGKRLFVVTDSQMVYWIDVASSASASLGAQN